MNKKRTVFYFDGFNLHHGMLKNTPQRWLDLEKFANALLPRPDEHEIIRINYFTARIKYDPSRPKEAFNQDRYLEALTAYPLVRVVEGYYKRFKVKLPFAKEPCKSCDKASYGIVWKTEEKRSDVNLATEMMADVYRDAADTFVLVSGDADLAAPLCFIRHIAKKQTLVFNPQIWSARNCGSTLLTSRSFRAISHRNANSPMKSAPHTESFTVHPNGVGRHFPTGRR